MDEFRKLRKDEIKVRVQQVKEWGAILLLYKDARCDMNILDETVGRMNWKREHSRDNHNCTVSIWDGAKGAWVSKEDTGTESNTEAAKGLASDSFKRACTNWGIGRELYDAPKIKIYKQNVNIKSYTKNGQTRYSTYDEFRVARITYNRFGMIDGLAIKNQDGKTVFMQEPKDIEYLLKEEEVKPPPTTEENTVDNATPAVTYEQESFENALESSIIETEAPTEQINLFEQKAKEVQQEPFKPITFEDGEGPGF